MGKFHKFGVYCPPKKSETLEKREISLVTEKRGRVLLKYLLTDFKLMSQMCNSSTLSGCIKGDQIVTSITVPELQGRTPGRCRFRLRENAIRMCQAAEILKAE